MEDADAIEGHAFLGERGDSSDDCTHLFVGIGRAIESCTLCEQWSAYKALRLGLINRLVPVLRTNGRFIPNPAVHTDRWIDEKGSIVYGEFKTGAEATAAKAMSEGCEIDLSPLDAAVEQLATKLLYTMPDCLTKTIESLRKKKLEHWFANSESNRSWLALNMNTEAAAGFPAFHFGDRDEREIDFARLRRRLAEGAIFDGALVREVLKPSARAGLDA